jgi:hypothetical protein
MANIVRQVIGARIIPQLEEWTWGAGNDNRVFVIVSHCHTSLIIANMSLSKFHPICFLRASVMPENVRLEAGLLNI